MDKFDAMRVFAEVAHQGSFVAASRNLNLSAPAITRSVAQLESALGVRLFNRTTRQVRLTEAGRHYFDDAKRILEEVERAEAKAAGVYSEPKGLLTVTAPVLFGQLYVLPVITEYLKAYPSVNVQALFYDRLGNLLDEGLDVGIRVGALKDSSLYAVEVGKVRRVVCASAEYLKHHAPPQTPEDLQKHSIILATAVDPSTEWHFNTAQGKRSVNVTPRLCCSQNGAALKAVSDGVGITRLMSYQVGEELKKGKLVRLLTDLEPPPIPVNIVYLEGRRANAKVRSFIEFAAERLRGNTLLQS